MWFILKANVCQNNYDVLFLRKMQQILNILEAKEFFKRHLATETVLYYGENYAKCVLLLQILYKFGVQK